ncbi:MAG: branched-chain amino acid ABC transporter permease [Defluviitaleaceae bacterium]|nr:branched-chain amino acid ABC transporter permease [Defluviitaleaceae bacterium]
MILQRLDTIRKIEVVIIVALAIVLLIVPHVAGTATVTMVSRIMIFAVFAMSYDILRGYVGVIHLGYALFIGGGAYFVGILFTQFGVGIPMLLLAVVGTSVYSAIWALIVGKISGKSGMIATAMITMAFAEIMRSLMTSWFTVTRGADGLPFRVPPPFNDRTMMFYASFIFMVIMAFLLYKFTKSPTGRVWQAVRENEQRAIFLGYNTNRARTIALLVASVVGGLSGVMFGLLNRFVNTDLLDMQMTINAMLYSLIGGTGTLFGAILGSALVVYFQNLLLDLRGVHFIFERWLLFIGALYIVVVMFMPRGIMGFYYDWKDKRAQKKRLLQEAKLPPQLNDEA